MIPFNVPAKSFYVTAMGTRALTLCLGGISTTTAQTTARQDFTIRKMALRRYYKAERALEIDFRSHRCAYW